VSKKVAIKMFMTPVTTNAKACGSTI
jgi:hypothetical protein